MKKSFETLILSFFGRIQAGGGANMLHSNKIWNNSSAIVFLHPERSLFGSIQGLPDSIRVVQLILVQFVLVRIQVRQHPATHRNPVGFFMALHQQSLAK